MSPTRRAPCILILDLEKDRHVAMNDQSISKKIEAGKIGLVEQLYRESRAMAEYAFTNGLKVPAAAVTVLERLQIPGIALEKGGQPRDTADIEALVGVHTTLSRLVSPAKPRTIVLLDKEKSTGGALRFLGPVSLIRQLMLAALICLVLFIGLTLSKSVDSAGGNILKSSGIPLLLNLLFYLSAAGLGASFAALYKANHYITNGTFDPTYHASYWIRFFLGLIAGLLLSVLISDKVFNNSQLHQGLLEPGIVRPLLAILGGFSADVAYTVLSRLVETVESLFQGSTKNLIANKVSEEKNQLAQTQTQQQMKLATDLVNLQQQLSQGGDSEHAAAISKLLSDLLPDSDIAPLKAPAPGTPAS